MTTPKTRTRKPPTPKPAGDNPVEQSTSGIHPSLRALAVSVDLLDELPGNPNVGDVDAVARSYERFGQRKPLVAVPTPVLVSGGKSGERWTVIAGNTQLRAARRLGWAEVAVLPTDDDEIAAKAYALADNRTAELGSTDDVALLAMIRSVEPDPLLFAASAYDVEERERLARYIEAITAEELDPLREWEGMPEFTGEGKPPAFRLVVNFPAEESVVEFFRRIERPVPTGHKKAASIWWPESDGHVGSDVTVVEVRA